MSDLTEFLLARIAEDEGAVRRLLAEERWAGGRGPVANDEPFVRVLHWSLTPARVLAECDAKRRIVEEASRYGVPRTIRPEFREYRWMNIGDLVEQHRRFREDDPEDEDDWPFEPIRLWKREDYEAQVLSPPQEFIFLRLLAMPYADHPDYDEAWRP